MHMYAEHIGEFIKENYHPEKMMISPTGAEDLDELGKYIDIMKDISEYDKNMRIIKAMDDAENDEIAMGSEDIVAKVKKAYSHADAAKKVTMKAELTKMIQTM